MNSIFIMIGGFLIFIAVAVTAITVLDIKKIIKEQNSLLASTKNHLAGIAENITTLAGEEFTEDFILHRAALITGQEILHLPGNRKVLGNRNPEFE